MAVKNASFGHFLLRVAGVTGFFAAVVGLVLWLAMGVPDGMYVAAGGGALVALALLLDIPTLLRGTMSKRGAVGGTVVLQILLAIALFTGVNVFSYFHYTRMDLTRDHRFTLDQKWRDQLAKLNQDTTIVIYQRHTAFGQSPENPPDNYDAAAQRQIIERVKDLAEQFQDLGPRFQVEVLDSYDDSFEDRLIYYKEHAPRLAEAIEAAKENSIFFYAPKRERAEVKEEDEKDGFVQIISFNDIFQLDRTASRGGEDGRRNLVLRDQGVDAFVHKVLNIQEKRPKIAFAVAHEFLGVKGDSLLWGMGGVKKTLQARGIEFQDIVLKKFGGMGPPTATVLTHDESKFEGLEFVITELESAIADHDKTIQVYAELDKDFTTLPLAEVNKKYFFLARPGRPIDIFSESELEMYKKERGWREGKDYFRVADLRITPQIRTDYLEERVSPILRETRQVREIKEKKLEQAKSEIKKLNVEQLVEQKRISDLRAKFNKLLADVDLLVIPRLTLIDALRNPPLEYEIHKLEDPQVAAIKDFIKSGRPVLFLMDPPFERENSVDEKGDGVDQLLRDLNVVMPAQTVLFDVEIESLIQGKGSGLRLGRLAEVPPVSLDLVTHSAPRGMKGLGRPTEKQPIRESLLVASESLGKDLGGDLRLRNPRPIYLMRVKLDTSPKALATLIGAAAAPATPWNLASPLLGQAMLAPDESAVVLSTAQEGWNTGKPFAEDEIPRYTPPEPDNPDVGTWKESRRGPFPVAIAFETYVPEEWVTAKEQIRKVRLAVIGDGEIFKGETLTPMRERVLLDTSNWLMGRDDLLAQEVRDPWSFLRVNMNEQDKIIWSWSMALGLPLLFIYLGMIVMFVRRLR